MRKHLISSALRLFLFFVAAVLWLGLWLTGFDKVHWLLYAFPVFFIFAAVTGICPGIIMSRLVMGDKPQA